jgi:hypothetical protein
MTPHWSRVAWRVVILTAGLIAMSFVHAGVLSREPDGRVRFYNIADSDFDRYSSQPNSRDQAWMRRSYARMQTYSTYFDRRLSWYPNAWVYKDSYAIKSHWPVFKQHPEWVLKDAGGRALYIPWGCRNGSCPQYAADIGNAAFRAHWIEEAHTLVANGYVGIFVDDVNLAWRVSDGNGRPVEPINPRTGSPMTLSEWQGNFATFVGEIRTAFPNIEIAHNSIWYADAFDNPNVLRQIDAADYINLERGATDRGLDGGTGKFGFERFLSFIDLVHARGKGVIMMDYGDNPGAREFGLATWFLVNAGADLMSSNQLAWTAPGSLWHGYELDLGASLGRRYNWRGALRRDFDCGYVVLNPPDAAHMRIELASGDRRIDADSGGTMDLAARTAAVVEHACGKALDASLKSSEGEFPHNEP